MDRRTFIRTALAGTAALTSTGMGLLLSACHNGQMLERTGVINNADKLFAGYGLAGTFLRNVTV